MNSGDLMAAAWTANQAGRLEEAYALCKEAVERSPRDPGPRLAIAMVSYRMGMFYEAWEHIQPLLNPRGPFPPALSWAAAILLALGQPSEAAEYADKAIRVAPKNPEPHGMAGQAYLALERHEQALASFQKAASLAPMEATHLYGMVAALTGLKRKEEAVEVLRRAIKINPEIQGLASLVELELELGMIDQAISHCELGLKLEPTSPEIHTTLAVALTQTNRRELAESHWQAAKLSGNAADVSNRKGYALLSLGLFEEGIEAFSESIHAEPDEWLPYSAIISAKRVGEEDRQLVKSLERLANPSMTAPEDLSQVHFALGKAYDNLKEYELAMSHYDQAHEAIRTYSPAYKPFDLTALQKEVDDKIRFFTKDLLQRAESRGSQSTLPIFVLGMMRSGTTLVEQILTCHPEIGGAGEQSFWLDVEPDVLRQFKSRMDWSLLRRLADRYCGLLSRLSPRTRHVVEKNPGNCMLAGLLHLALPNARIIHTVRTPIDNALSIWNTPMETIMAFVHEKGSIVTGYREYARLAGHWREVIPKDRILEIRYEELVSNSEEVTRGMVEFCGLEWNEACIFPERNPKAVKTPSFWQVRQPVNQGSVEKWRRYEPWLGPLAELIQ